MNTPYLSAVVNDNHPVVVAKFPLPTVKIPWAKRPENLQKIKNAQKKYRASEHGKEHRRNYLNKNRAAHNANGRQWRTRNPERAKAICKKSRLKNYGRFRETLRKHKQLNKKQYAEYDRQRRITNPERHKAWFANWCKKNPSKTAERNARYRARKWKCSINRHGITAFLERIKQRPKIRCYYCGHKVSTSIIHLEHVHCLYRGGKHELGNVCISCPTCNFSKGFKSLAEWQPNQSQRLLPL